MGSAQEQNKSTEKEEQIKESQENFILMTVHKAKKLEKRGIFGKANPYVVVKTNVSEYRSKVLKNTVNPEWNFSNNVQILDRIDEKITIQVFDDLTGSDVSLGKVEVPLDNIKSKSISNEWFRLDDCNSGKILLSAEIVMSQPLKTMDKEKESYIQIPEVKEKLDETQNELFEDVGKNTDVRGAKGLSNVLKQEKEIVETKKELKVTDKIESKKEPIKLSVSQEVLQESSKNEEEPVSSTTEKLEDY